MNAEASTETQVVPELLTKAMVCELLGGVTTKHIENLVRRGSMPEPIYLDRYPRWRRTDLVDWIDAGCPIVDQGRYTVWEAEQRQKNEERRRQSAKSKSR